MEKRNAALLLLCLAAVLCWCTPEEAAESAEDPLNSAATNTGIYGAAQHSQAQRFPGHNRQPHRDTEDHIAQRLVDIAETQRYASGKSNEMGEMASDLAGGLKEKVKDKAFDAYAFCSEKAEQGIDMASNLSEEIGKCSASSSYGYVSDRMNQAGDMAYNIKDSLKDKACSKAKLVSDKVGDEKDDTMEDRMSIEKSEAFKRFKDAKSEVFETRASAMDTMTEQAKEEYEHAKERASQATGDLGAKMRTCPS